MALGHTSGLNMISMATMSNIGNEITTLNPQSISRMLQFVATMLLVSCSHINLV